MIAKICVTPGAVPVAVNWFGFDVDIHGVLFCQSVQNVACHPKIIASFEGIRGEALEFPLPHSHLGVGAGEFDAYFEAFEQMTLGQLTTAHLVAAHAAVIKALWFWVTAFGETQGDEIFGDEIFLLKTPPKTCFVKGCLVFAQLRTSVGGVGCSIAVHDFAHDQVVVFGPIVGAYRLEHALGFIARGLLGGGTIEIPYGAVRHLWCLFPIMIDDLNFRPQVRGEIAIEPHVFEQNFRHHCLLRTDN